MPAPFRLLLLLLVFLSGACALAYEIVWQRMLLLVFGNGVYATATVLSAFMAGLALGGYHLGKRADAARRPLRLLALIEAGTGLCAAAFPAVLRVMTSLYLAVHRAWHPPLEVSGVLRFLLCVAGLILPTALMGGTLAVVSRCTARRAASVAKNVGWLYCVNTAGGVAGALLAGYLSIEALGLAGTTRLASIVNLGIAASLLILDRRAGSQAAWTADRDGDAGASADRPAKLPPLVLLTAGVSGFCALAYEVFWTRALVYFFETSI